ncbi:MAG TPA: thrombospondin type 3 repeat-containing protein [Nannocystaceae bacterium]|nr:thrombospondin type 3 repeat-containing protein [Nannocystaceae bacterium]
MALSPLVAAGGCIHDADCGICDPQSLVLESITGANYQSKKIHVLGPACEGDRCPGELKHGQYFVTDFGPCETSEDALAAPRGPEEFCKLSPLVVAYGIEFIFNNLLDPTSIELVRKRPDQPKLFEVYDWKTRILAIEGPITRFNGDVRTGSSTDPDVVTRAVNLACVDNLADAGVPYGHEDYEDPASDPCNGTRTVDGQLVPMKMRIGTPDAVVTSYRGITTHGSADQHDCVTAESGPDVCCSECDWLLTTKIAKYGITADGTVRTPNYAVGAPPGNGAIACDAAAGDPYVQCRDFIPSVDRGPEQRSYEYHWSCDPGTDASCKREAFALPRYDKLRETHPDLRPAWIENRNASCTTTSACRTEHDLPGAACIGTKNGQACDPERDPECTGGVCRPQWFAECRPDQDTTGADRGYCVDIRYAADDAGACLVARNDFEGQCEIDGTGCRDVRAGSRLSLCDSEEGDGALSAAECCQDALGPGIDACDPTMQAELAPLPRYDRNEHLPEQARTCICEDDPPAECDDLVDTLCRDGDGRIRDDRRGQYAIAFIDRPGGVIYDPAIKGFEWRPADAGSVPRARVEECAEAHSLIAERNRHDGWRGNDANFVENFEDFDRAMCSGSTYRVTFATPGEGEALVDKVGNDLSGKSVYTFETPQFHVVPGSGFPADALRIGACDDFGLQLSNRYDISPENLRKIAIYEVEKLTAEEAKERDPELLPKEGCGLVPIAGGPACHDDADTLDDDFCGAPCLTVDIAENGFGKVRVSVDAVRFDSVLQPGKRYRMVLPGLDSIDDMADPERYRQAFWDACGMPLVLGGTKELDFLYDFDIDDPKCKEDPDGDKIPDSCDNADDVPNKLQDDFDLDGIGDVVDLCPVVASNGGNNQGDSDDDGIGNDCDVCRRPTKQYNVMSSPGGGFRMLVDNNPAQTDSDDDGIGDVCDNCITVANCGSYSADKPWSPGEPIPYDDVSRCQADVDEDMVGDACVGLFSPGAAAAVGLDDEDDFDQDGLVNAIDKCPRLPAPATPCEAASDCPVGSTCEPCPEGNQCLGAGTCNHIDGETNDEGVVLGDGVGDACDTCPARANPMQRFDQSALEDDDADGDFIGIDCETSPECNGTGGTEARPFGFYEISAEGYCCTLQLEARDDGFLYYAGTNDLLMDGGVRREDDFTLEREPVPVTLDCQEAEDPLQQTCRRLPEGVADMPGVLTLPSGCEEALGALDWRDNRELVQADFAASASAAWDRMCLLPPRDQDFDGLGDRCDLCRFDYDPKNAAFVDINNRVWPKSGAVCNGAYALDKRCAADGTDTDGESTSESGSESGTDSASSSGG